MKNLFATVLFALSLSTSAVSFAANLTTDPGQAASAVASAVTIEQIVESKLDVVVKNTPNLDLVISLADASGKAIATKTLNKKKINTRVRFDLTKLADGVYHVRVKDGKNTQVKKFEIKTSVPTEVYSQEVTLI